MSEIMKIVGYILFGILVFAIFDDSTKPDLTISKVAGELGVALAMIAIGYLGDIRNAIKDLKPKPFDHYDPPSEP